MSKLNIHRRNGRRVAPTTHFRNLGGAPDEIADAVMAALAAIRFVNLDLNRSVAISATREINRHTSQV